MQFNLGVPCHIDQDMLACWETPKVEPQCSETPVSPKCGVKNSGALCKLWLGGGGCMWNLVQVTKDPEA